MILITGGSGFIGKHVTAHLLLTTNRKIRIFSRNPKKIFDGLDQVLQSSLHTIENLHTQGLFSAEILNLAKKNISILTKNINDRVDLMTGTITSDSDVTNALLGVNAVINLAGIIREVNDASFEDVNINGVERLLRLIDTTRVNNLTHLSTLESETNENQRYSYSKLQADKLIMKSNLNYSIIRSSLVLGPNDGFSKRIKQSLLMPLPIFPLPDGGNQLFQPISVYELSFILSSTLQPSEKNNRLPKIYSIGGPEHISFKTLVKYYAEKEGKFRFFLPVPSKLLNVPIKILAEIMMDPLVTQNEMLELKKDNITKLNSVKTHFGFEPSRYTDFA